MTAGLPIPPPDRGRIRVAYLFMTLDVGGAEELARGIIQRLPPPFEGILCCLGSLGEMGRELQAQGQKICSLDAVSGKRFSVSAMFRLRRWLRENRIGIVHGNMYHADLYGRLAAWPLPVPYFSHVHNVYTHGKRHRAWLNRLLARRTTKVLCVSEAVAEDVRRVDNVPPEKIEVLINAIDLADFSADGPRAGIREELRLRPEERLIGTVGSLTEKKNQALLLEATAQLAARGMVVHCVICGEGKLRALLQERIRALGLQDRAHLLGVRRPIAPVLREMDVFALPSHYEGVPLALLQAMACGLPVVVSDAAGILRVTGLDHAGIVSQPDSAAFADRIESFLRNPERGRAVAARQREAILPRFSHKAYMERLVQLYENALRTGE